jgi:hypothetical protein
VRVCAKMRCEAEAVVTVRLEYAERLVVVGEVRPGTDGLDLCREHVDRMTPPMGWSVADDRVTSSSLAG